MKFRSAFIVISLSALLLYIAACSAASPTASTTSSASTNALDGASLVQERCTMCHPLSRIENSRHSAAEWKTIVDTMISRGAQLSADEETALVNWLAANYAP